MSIIAHSINEISHLAKKGFEQIEAGESDFSTFVKDVQRTMRGLSVDIVEDVMAKTEDSIFRSPERKKNFRVQRSNDEKIISTILGDVRLNRRYYQSKVNDQYIYLLDDFLGIEPHQRIDGSLEEDILEKASQMSYQDTIDSYDDIGIHTRMTVKNIVHKYEAKSTELPTGDKKTVPYLYIEADEDHVAYQDGSNQEIRLVYVHEGFRAKKSEDERDRLKITRRFAGRYKDTDELWADVAYYLEEQYDTSKCKQIYLSGDGAHWIKKGLDFLPAKTKFVLDPFHTSQSLRKASVGIPDVFPTLCTWVRKDRPDFFDDYFNVRLADDQLTESMRDQIRKQRTYLRRHWSAIQAQKDSHYISCSAEGHVSHYLSARLSSRPMGWSNRGADHMAKLRVFRLNGGKLREIIQHRIDNRRKERKIRKLDRRVSSKHKNAYRVAQGRFPVLEHSTDSDLRKGMKQFKGL